MAFNTTSGKTKKPQVSGLLALLNPYRFWIAALVILTILANGLNLVVPKIIARAIDSYVKGGFISQALVWNSFSRGFLFLFLLTFRV